MTLRTLACAVAIASILVLPGRLPAQSAGTSVLPPTIPIFPLPGTVLFPNISLPLHIFEGRYRVMVAEALEGDRIIGMVLLQPGYESNYEGRPAIFPIGCAGVITQAEQLPDGRFNIVLRGLVKFRVTGEDSSRPYRLAHVNPLPELVDDKDRTMLREQRRRLEELVVASSKRAAPGPMIPLEVADEDVVNGLAQYLELQPAERQTLLERPGVLARSQALVELLEKK